LYSSAEVAAFLDSLKHSEASDGRASATGTASSIAANESQPDGATSRKAKATEHRQGRQDTQYTVEQIAIVERVRKCKHHEYYEILELEKTANDSQVKKRYSNLIGIVLTNSYRKLALQLHPDKNGAPGADEAFKSIRLIVMGLTGSGVACVSSSFGSRQTCCI